MKKHQMPSFQPTSQSVINNHPQTAARQINPSQLAPYIHQNVSSSSQSLLMQSQKHVAMRRGLAATNLQQNQSTCLGLPQQQHMLAYQQHDAQQHILHGQNTTLSGPHHERQLNPMQRQRHQVEQDGQHRHQGMPASTLLMEGEVYRRLQMLKCKYERDLIGIHQRLTQNPDRHNISKLEELKTVKRLSESLKYILRTLNELERNIKPMTEESLGLIEKKFLDILRRCIYQEEKKPPLQTVNTEHLTTKMQQNDSQQHMLHGQNINLSGPHHERQLNPMQRHRNQVEQDGQHTHQMTGMPASTLLMEGDAYQKLQMLKSKYGKPLMDIYQKVQSLRQNPRHNINNLEQLNQTVTFILTKLNVRESNIKPTTEGQLGLFEKKIVDILCRYGYQEGKKPPPQTVNTEHLSTKMQQNNRTNLMNYSEPPMLKHGTQHLQGNLTRKDSDQASSSRYLTMPTSSPQQANMMILSSQNPIQSNVNNLETSSSVPRHVHQKQSKEQQDVQTQKPKQQLLHEENQLMKLQSEPKPLQEDHNSSGQLVPKNTCQGESTNLPMHHTEARSPLNPPSGISSLAPQASSPMPVDCQKPMSDTPPCSNSGNIGDEQLKGVPEASSLSTPSTVESDEVQPIQKLIKVVNSMSSNALSASALDIASVVCTTDTIKMKHPRSTLPIDGTSESGMKRPRLEVNQTLLQEIGAINLGLVDTVLDISNQECALPVKDGEGTIVRCSFIGMSISPSMLSMFPLQLRLLVPSNYPLCSPIFLDKLTVQVRNELEEDLSAKVMSKLSRALRTLEEPLSLGEIAREWETCARAVVCEFAQQYGGGSFSSKNGTWEDLLSEDIV